MQLKQEFGYEVNPRDPQFASKIAEKEKEYAKAAKEAKKQQKFEKRMKEQAKEEEASS